MIKNTLLSLLLLASISISAQSLDEIFDDDNMANQKNAVYFSVYNLLSGVPSISYERVLVTTNFAEGGIIMRLSGGMQVFNPVINLPKYLKTTKLENLFYSQAIFDDKYIIEYDSLLNNRFFGLETIIRISDEFFSTDNYVDFSAGFMHDVYEHKSNPFKVNNVKMSAGYIFMLQNFRIGLRTSFGVGFVNYIKESDFLFHYSFDVNLGYSF
jgi:hypothetical protein